MSAKKKKSILDFEHGELVWAKVSGFQHWPGQVTDPTQSFLVPRKMRKRPKENMLLVRFFGSYDFHWVSVWAVDSYEKGISKRFHSKSKSKLFLLSLQEAKTFSETGQVPSQFLSKSPEDEGQSSCSEEDGDVSSEHSAEVPHCDDVTLPDQEECLDDPECEDHFWMSEVERNLSNMEHDNGWSGVLLEVDTEPDQKRKSSRTKCLTAMRLVGLAPPELHLGRQLGTFYTQ